MRAKTERKRIVESLRRVSLFADCDDRELLQIDRLFTGLELKLGKTLATRGTAKLQFVIVCDGYGRVTSPGEDIGRVGPGSYVGEHTFQGSGWDATITALTPMSVLVLNASEFASLLRVAPSVKARMERESATRPIAEPAPSFPIRAGGNDIKV
ncbi:MAG: cyclic nucleotide-binding domain-containing protein [Actinomycetota bacterium]